MAQATKKIVQSYVQALNQVIKLVKQADVLAQAYKAKFVAKNPDLTGTNITAGQITAVNTFITSLNDLANGSTATAIVNKDQPSHGIKDLD